MTTTHLTYIFDPLCGWCYGAGPALETLRALEGVSISLAPSGLFAGAGARPMDREFAAFAWQNDQRIAQMTGQTFSQAYRDNVLAAPAGSLDSGTATLGIVATGLTAGPEHELPALKALQQARYADGRDNTRLESVAAILTDAGFGDAAARLADADADLLAACSERIEAARADMARFGLQGVPALIAERDGQRGLVPPGALFGDLDALVRHLTAA
ncbi:DsbA family protein [Novosphingobium beihaiensis]|uniref:DsbA family protein n=1 Tax=Novosphingobium beihaiensis TaxID=2930389 RepID=A0ABT0BLD0_9SPHN|nr:DsbA family protein [Novosphingobium beihaiensis]MCJ2185863.1 DsbA family protein [Novosphingobium beihaiensis]